MKGGNGASLLPWVCVCVCVCVHEWVGVLSQNWGKECSISPAVGLGVNWSALLL